MDDLDDMGVSKLSAKVFLKVNYFFKHRIKNQIWFEESKIGSSIIPRGTKTFQLSLMSHKTQNVGMGKKMHIFEYFSVIS